MKKIITLKYLLILVTLFFSSCDKDFELINTNPNSLGQDVFKYNYLFTAAQLYTAGNSDGYSRGIWEGSLSYASTFMQQLSSTSGFWYGDKYVFNNDYLSAFWLTQFGTSVKSITDVISNINGKEDQGNFLQIARILKVFIFQRITDQYGDIPYFQAGKGFSETLTDPVYDSQAVIYDDMLAELEDAVGKLDPDAPNTLGDADLFYKGDVTQWTKFAYSEMLRLAMRMSKVDPEKAKTWAGKAASGGVMETNDDNAIIYHETNDALTENPVGAEVITREPASYRLSKTLIDFLKNKNDPRLPALATVVEDPEELDDPGNTDPLVQLGQANGYDFRGGATDLSNSPGWTGNQNDFSIINRTTFARVDAPSFLLTAGNTQLLMAEAAQRGWISGSAADYYAVGVVQSILQLNQAGAGIAESDAEVYLAANPWLAADGIRQINEQYWVATFGDWLETWSNWRRSGYPELVPVNYEGNITNGSIPRRFTYPIDEARVNPKNYSAAVNSINGGDKITSRVWWDSE
ncbi:MAG TPA: SusD/RagB family nutrient-binding outer membrane lipoprotein [Flavitalea sp.]|nr:SusD/RagB family nutrient-binding outer membrane lipoprotein [Flavitalea sp.]